MFLNDKFLFIKDAELANLADDNSYVANKDLTKLLETVQNEREIALEWFINVMIVSPEKFQSMIFSAKKNLSCKSVSKINGPEITSTLSVN